MRTHTPVVGPPISLMEVRRGKVRRGLLAAGVLASLYYAAINGVVAWAAPGYSSAHQTVSELSAIDAPTRTLWIQLASVYSLLALLFGFGVLASSGTNRLIRISGWLIVVNQIVGVFWPPMHQRGVETMLTDTLHIVFTALWGLMALITMGLAAAALRGRFRAVTLAAIALTLLFGFLTGLHAGDIPKGRPTPWIGVWERVNIGVVMAWFAFYALALWRYPGGPPEGRNELAA